MSDLFGHFKSCFGFRALPVAKTQLFGDDGHLAAAWLSQMTKETLNTRRLLCPLPVIRTQEKIKHLSAGDVLEVVGTDPGILQDIPAWCRVHGHRVLEVLSGDYEYTVILQVGP